MFFSLSLSLALACSHKTPIDSGPPVLPAMQAPLYAAAPYTPSDPLVAAVVDGHPIDESLSGAAAAVALARSEAEEVDGSTVTWAAYRSGWPHQITGWQLTRVPEGERPGDDFEQRVSAWLASGVAVGVARARGQSGDTWVALASRPWIALEPFPREHPRGSVFSWPVIDEGRWGSLTQVGMGPALAVREGPLELDIRGEWIVELRGVDASESEVLLARVPLYVDTPTPYDGPFEAPIDQDTPDAILGALDELRGLENAPPLRGDVALEAAAQQSLKALLQTGAPDPAALDRLARLGYPEAAELTCTGGNVTECLEDLWWSIDDRRRLLEPEFLRVGVAAARGDALVIVVNLASELTEAAPD